MHKYEIIIYWSEEDRAFVAEVPELPGCAAHGNSPDKALLRQQQGNRSLDQNGQGIRKVNPRAQRPSPAVRISHSAETKYLSRLRMSAANPNYFGK